MRRPKLNRPLLLEAPETEPDGAGGFVETWRRLGVIWGEVRPGSGRLADHAELALTITVRATPQGAPSRPRLRWRFVDGDRVYRITSVTESDASGRYLTCLAQEEVGR